MDDVLEEAGIGGEGVQESIGLTLDANASAEGELGVLTSVASGDGVNLSDGDLDRGMILGGDQAVSGGALTGDVEIDLLSFGVLHVDVK